MLSAEQQCLLECAKYTWLRRGVAKFFNMPFGEESVTETILLDLKIFYPGKMWIVPFNKIQESKIGADWEWCFANAAEDSFLPMLVQAKVLDDKEAFYSHISRKIGNTGKRQIDQLLETSAKRSVPATYAFYNHITDLTRLSYHCGSLISGESQSEPWGISIAKAESILNLLPDQSFDSIWPVSKPLHCLLCTKGSGKLSKGGSPEAISQNIGRLVEGEISSRDDPWKPRQARPQYYNIVKEFADARYEGDDEYGHRRQMRDELAAANPELDGIIILRDSQRSSKRD